MARDYYKKRRKIKVIKIKVKYSLANCTLEYRHEAKFGPIKDHREKCVYEIGANIFLDDSDGIGVFQGGGTIYRKNRLPWLENAQVNLSRFVYESINFKNDFDMGWGSSQLAFFSFLRIWSNPYIQAIDAQYGPKCSKVAKQI